MYININIYKTYVLVITLCWHLIFADSYTLICMSSKYYGISNNEIYMRRKRRFRRCFLSILACVLLNLVFTPPFPAVTIR